MQTFIQLIELAIEQAKSEKSDGCPPPAAREFSIAVTALEDASMRFNRGMAIKNGLFEQRDVQAKVLSDEAAILEAAEGAVHPDQLSMLADGNDVASAA